MSEKFAAMDTSGETQNDLLHLPAVAPSKNKLASHIKNTEGVHQTVKDVRQKFDPSHDQSKFT